MPSPNAICNVIPCRLDSEAFLFVSYAHDDADVVFPIIEGVSANGYHIWYDKGINISSTWTDEIANAILGCKAFVIFITRNSMMSTYVRSEVEFALNNHIKIIPVYLEGIHVLPPGLALGLNSTQGITNITDPARITAGICEAMEYNQIPKKGEIKDTAIRYKPYKAKRKKQAKNSGAAIVKIIVAGLVLIIVSGIIGAVVLVMNGADGLVSKLTQGDRPTELVNTASAAPPVATATPAPTADNAVSVRGTGDFTAVPDKETYLPGENILVKLPDVTAQMVQDKAFVALYTPDAKNNRYISYAYMKADAGEVVLNAPPDAGNYELRGFAIEKGYQDAEPAMVIPITVDGDYNGIFQIAFPGEKDMFVPGGTIYAEVSGISAQAVQDKAFVAIYAAGAEHTKSLTRVNIPKDGGSVKLAAPLDEGSYELRAYARGNVANDATMVVCLPFTIGGTAKGLYTATLDKASYVPGGTITVTTDGVPQSASDDRSFVAVYDTGAAFNNYYNYKYATKNTEELLLEAPLLPGTYEVRGLAKDGVKLDSNIVLRIEFTVEGDSSRVYTFTTDKETYAPKETIRIITANVSQEAIADKAVIGLFQAGAEHRNGDQQKTLSKSAEELVITAPETPGTYEIRGYAKYGIEQASNLVYTVTIVVE